MTSNLKLSKVINASGKMTALGGSILNPEVSNALKLASEQFYVIQELMEVSSNYVAQLLEVEAAHFVLSASSGIAQSVGASIAKDNLRLILNSYDTSHSKREIIIAKGHVVNYGTSIEVPIRMGGGVIVEAGFSNGCSIDHYRTLINENTAAIVYVISHHTVSKSMANLKEVIDLAKANKIPIIVDAAAEGDLKKYAQMGADVVIYSGTKAIEGPTSGLVVGQTSFIEMVRLQYLGIGRVMKLGKEGILGLVKAIERYVSKTPMTIEDQIKRLTPFVDNINEIENLKASIVQDGAGRPIMRALIKFNSPQVSQKIVKELASGELKIFTRDHRANEGYLEVDIRDVSDEELEIVYQRINDLVKEIQG